MSQLKKLYQNEILEEAKHPYHFEKREHALNKIRAYNPICGDRFDLYIDDSIHFHGFGCTISKASTSFMIRALEKRSDAEALILINSFLDSLDKNKPINHELLKVFQNKEHFRGRGDCVVLCWKAMKDYFESKS